MLKKTTTLIFLLFSSFIQSVFADRLKDLVSIAGIRTNQLLGYGIVIGLNGTGDSTTNLTLQSIQSLISQFDIVVSTSDLTAKNAAAVMVTADLPAFQKPGQTLDVTVSAIGKAKSLRGGTLLMTPLKGADGELYAIAQGNLAVGGLGVEGADGSSVSVNIPTVGRIPKGATVEKMVESPFIRSNNLVLNLHQGDFSTANIVSEKINEIFGPEVAVPLDATSIKVRAPEDPGQKVSFVSLLENIEVEPARPKARVVVNARTGTIVIGGDVKVTPTAVTHGKLTVSIQEDTAVVSEAQGAMQNANSTVAGTAATTAQDTQIGIEEEDARAFIFDTGTSLSEIVDAINNVGASAADLVAILEALREAGSLRAELIII
ncbi:MAG: flagellar basal body P-ring protein FlgI [Alphaproteobacteria bacterium TMED93]|nr:MAG: flagellar basal body P-ring protein FlgI [Alphaproteobacteria bacterium TMED93]